MHSGECSFREKKASKKGHVINGLTGASPLSSKRCDDFNHVVTFLFQFLVDINQLFCCFSRRHWFLIMSYSGEEKKQEAISGIAHRLARPNILELHPYRCARDDYSSGILLDANENALGPTSLPTNSLDPYDNHNVLERYPDPYQIALKEKYAQYRGHGLKPENIFVGVGSDEAIDLLMRIFCRPGQDTILITPPTYGMYKVCAKVNDVQVINCPLTPDFDLRINEVRAPCHACLTRPK
jgi:hypothetical protein